MPVLPIAVVVDVDPDWRSGRASGQAFRGDMQWEGLVKGIPELLRMVQGLRDSGGQGARFTWMLRSDEQMAAAYGDPAYVADEFGDLWESRQQAGDEIGWHPHLWRFSEQERIWHQEKSDVDWVRPCLEEGFAALSRRFQIRAAKPGWTYHDNLTMRMFSDLGLKVDLSALPGMSYHGFVPGTDFPLGQYDWSRAPQEPYHPRGDDYQMPGDGNALPILEVPNWTFPIGNARRMFHRARGRSWRDFANPAKKPILVGRGFRHPPYTVPFVCYFHPEELLGPTWIFGASHVVRNLGDLLVVCANRGFQSKFVVASDLCPGS